MKAWWVLVLALLLGCSADEPGISGPCATADDGALCTDGPLVAGRCVDRVCRCFFDSGCLAPAGCERASCVSGSCALSPAGCGGGS